MIRRVALLLAFTLCASLSAQVPSPEQYLGYAIGERFTSHQRILDYFTELTKRSSLITMRQIGETYEHRPLMLATITSAKNRAALDAVQRNIAMLAAGEGDVESLAKNTPAVVWLAFGVHGNESSSAEASMMVAHTLLTDPSYLAMLDDLVVVIDPLLNPDGRERYTEFFRRTTGVNPNAKPEAFEHQEPWPGGRYNHYLIDMNRDWTWMSQRETQARVAAYREWNPQVFVDFHEMSYESTYFFPPDAKPINAHLPAEVEKWLDVFGRANAAEFSKRGWPFFVGETFDLFYPGYGDSWPALHGAVGMTYEMAGGGRGGSAVERDRRHGPASQRSHAAALHDRHHDRAHGRAESRGAAALHVSGGARADRRGEEHVPARSRIAELRHAHRVAAEAGRARGDAGRGGDAALVAPRHAARRTHTRFPPARP